MAAFQEDRYDVNGIETAVMSAGDGPPLVYFHGGGTVTGFDSLLPLAERFRVVVPHHPGYGFSADDPSIDDLHDYVLHYLDLFDQLELEDFALAGLSMGGAIAALFTIEHGHQVPRLVLCAPFGLLVREHPTVDFFSIPDEEVLGYLAADMSVFSSIEMPPTPEFLTDRYRESTSFARTCWKRPYYPKLQRWLHRITAPTLILWGDRDRLAPVEQAPIWAEHIPNAQVQTLPGIGHLLLDESREAVDAIAAFAAAESRV